MTEHSDLEQLTSHFVRLFPRLDETDQRLALHLYRSLARGFPVDTRELAESVALPETETDAKLRGWPGVYYDDSRRVIGFWGLTIAPTPHRLRSTGIGLYAWCAWDTLFLPELIGCAIEVESRCRGTGEPIRLSATPSGVGRPEPAEVVISFLVPDQDRVNADVITSFCHYVHFFRSARAAQTWLAEHPNSFLLSLADGFALGRRVNSARYGRLLSRTTTNGLFFEPAKTRTL